MCSSYAETEATIWSITDTDGIVNQLETGIYSSISKDQMQFKKEFSLWLIKFESWRQAIHIQKLPKTIIQCIIHFSYPGMHLVNTCQGQFRE